MDLRSHVSSFFSLFTRSSRERTRRVASGTALTLVSGLLVAMAVNAEGFPISEVDLNDGGVWVTKDQTLLVGRVNSQIKQLELAMVSASSESALFQQATDVQMVDLGGGTNRRIMIADVAGGALSKPVEVSQDTVVSAAGTTVAMVDTKTGRGWVMSAAMVDGYTNRTEPTLKDLGTRSNVVVAPDGTAYFLNRTDGSVVPVSLDVNRTPVIKDAIGLGGAELGDETQLTVVGTHPIVLDVASGTVHRGSDTLTLDDPKDAKLQQPQAGDVGASNDFYVASSTGLYRAGVSGGDLMKVSDVDVNGPPAAPVVVAGCAYAAWRDTSATKNFERVCGEEKHADTVRSLNDRSDLVFRVNRDVVVLNDAFGGNIWLVQAGMEIVDNWDTVDPRNKEKPEEVEEQEQKTNKNRPPTAKDDKDFGVRPGTTVVLPVTVNDTDPDGDILTIAPGLQSDSSDVQLSVVGNGTQVQAAVGPNVRGDVTFTYTISDGQPGNAESSADVTLKVVTGDDDAKPKKFKERQNELTVARGHETSVNVMPAWYDPDGDPLVLTKASSKGGDVRFRPDGTITFTDDGDSGSTDTIDFTLRGGQSETKAKVTVSVVDPAKAAPATVADRVSGVAGTPIVVEPLENDTDPLGGAMRVPQADPMPAFKGQIQRTIDGDAGLITVTAERAGTYYLTYVAANASAAAKPQTIRVDVISPSKSNHPPVAERDTATLVSGRSALVDVLANDSDPDGDVLVVRGFGDVPDGIKASLIDKRFVRIEATSPLTGTQEVTYHLSDGDSQVDGAITVSASEGDENRPPSALDDAFDVRSGTMVTLPILANDTDPDGDKLLVYGQDLSELPDGVPVVAQGSTVRVLVPEVTEPQQVEFSYTTHDPSLAAASAHVVLNVKPDSAKDNERPRPGPIEARAIAGKKVRIPLNAFNADPDGDPVAFTEITQQPAFGRIVSTGVDWIEYQPYEDAAGTDTLKVKVSDQYGASGTTSVRIGVAQREPVNQAPTALDDVLFVKPDRTIRYPVRDNDSDPDGDGFSLLPDVSAPEGVEVSVVGDAVELKSPQLDGRLERSVSAQYAVTDRLGGTSRATLTLTSSDLAPLYAPVAADDIVPLAEIAGKKPGDTVSVDVLDNDGDIDGATSDLSFEPVGEGTKSDGKLVVTLTADDQVVPYRLKDGDKQESFGFVYVSGTDSLAPVLDADEVPIKVVAGEAKDIDLRKIVNVRDGHTPMIARRDRITVVHGDNKTPSSKDEHTLTFRAPEDYYGPAAMLLDVTDGDGLNDPDGLIAQISVPIDVEPAANIAPVVRSTSVEVAAGGDAVELSTTYLASDANPDDDLTFEIGDGKDGVSGSVDGDTIVVKADEDARIGDVVELAVEVSDGHVKKPSTGTIRVSVVDSAKAPMALENPISTDGKAGQSTTIDVADHIVYDPFPKAKKELSQVKVVSGDGTATSKGTTLTITPAKGFDGVLAIGFQLSDGSGSAKRAVTGRVEVTVADVPDAPAAPSAVADGADAVRLSWSAPDDNGAPITEYQVAWNGGDKTCTGTQCLIDGLDPGTEYAFTVAARNAVGLGKPSPKSAPVTPDVVPEQMAAPTIDPSVEFPARDKKLDVSWTEPANEGSKITGYEIQQSPGGSKSFGGTTTNGTFGSLTNGTEYKFRARAINAKGEGPWSNWSEGSTPFTKPGLVSGVSASAAPPDSSGSGYVDVSWSAADAGGDPDGVAEYVVELVGGGQSYSKTVNGTVTSFSSVENGIEYKARVKAVNRAGQSADWGESNTVLVYDYASAPRNPGRVSDGDKSGVVEFDPPSDDGGLPITQYGYSTSDGNSGVATPSSSGGRTRITVKFTGNYDLSNKKSVTLWAIGQKGSTKAVSPNKASANNVFMPFGKPTIKDISTDGRYMAAWVQWEATPNGRPIDNVTYTGADSGTDSGPTGTVKFEKIEGGTTKCLNVVAHAGGLESSSVKACSTAKDRKVTISHGGSAGDAPKCTSGNCTYIVVKVEGFTAGSYPATVTESDDDGTYTFPSHSIGVGSNGRGEVNDYWYSGFYGNTIRASVDGVKDTYTNW